MQRYKCGMCVYEFAFPSHCERYMTTAHSGFGHICSECGKRGCRNYSLQIVKNSTRIFTGEEAVEF